MSCRTRGAGRAGATLALFGLLTGAMLPAPAVGASVSTGGPAPVMVVLDGSGSMNTSDAPGPRIVAAKKAVDGLVDRLPATARVGLEVYGTRTSSAPSAKAVSCRDISVLRPVGPIDKASFKATVAGIKARGYTPIGNALHVAAAALPQQGARSIVLVSDGVDTCAPPNPCTVARQLHAQGIGLTVDTVGFRVGNKARQELQCIADATGGVYRDAPDGPSLSQQLNTQVQRALRGYEAEGTPISGTPTPAGAPLMQPGQYLDTYLHASSSVGAFDGTAKYYSVDLQRGETPYVSATVVAPPRAVYILDDVQALVTLSEPGDPNCSIDITGDAQFGNVGGDVAPATAVATTPGPVGSSQTCFHPGRAIVKVSRSGTAYADEPLKVELAYRAEPPADASGLPGPASAMPNATAKAVGAPRPLRSGSSFNDAPLVAPGVYRDSFVTGEKRFVRVHLDWGQRLAYSITPEVDPQRAPLDGVPGQTTISNPLRESVMLADSSNPNDAFLGTSIQTPLSGSSAVPVRYTNRTATDSAVRAFSVAGDYYLVLSTGFANPLFADSYTLKISVIGKREPGPRYHPLVTAPRRNTPPLPSSAPPASGTPSSRPSGVARSRDAGNSTPVAAPSSGASGFAHIGHAGNSVPVAAGSAAVGVAIGAVAALALRRRRNSNQ